MRDTLATRGATALALALREPTVFLRLFCIIILASKGRGAVGLLLEKKKRRRWGEEKRFTAVCVCVWQSCCSVANQKMNDECSLHFCVCK